MAGPIKREDFVYSALQIESQLLQTLRTRLEWILDLVKVLLKICQVFVSNVSMVSRYSTSRIYLLCAFMASTELCNLTYGWPYAQGTFLLKENPSFCLRIRNIYLKILLLYFSISISYIIVPSSKNFLKWDNLEPITFATVFIYIVCLTLNRSLIFFGNF